MANNDVIIRVQYKDLTDAITNAYDLHRLLQAMGQTTYRVNFDYSQIQNALNAIQQASQQIQQFNQGMQNQQQQQTDRFVQNIDRNLAAIRDENNAWRDMEQQRQRQHEEEMRRQQEQQRQLQTTTDLINGLASAIEGIGSIAGYTSDFANAIGNSFSQIGNLFSTNITDYFVQNVANKFTDNLIGNLSSVSSRYDILRTFVPYMQLAGVDEASALAAQSKINESILGLPIGLDEAVQRLRRYNMYMNDLNAATNLTIGVQNAIMAGGAGASYQTQAYNMIERMLATGDLTNIRQWQALLVGLGVSQRYVEQELGLDQGALMEAIRSDTVSVEEFLGALQRLGSGATEASIEMQEALGIYKSTLESWISNIEFAVTRGNERVLGAINETLETVSGMGITGYMELYRDFLNDFFLGIAGFIRNNPDLIKTLLVDAQKLIDAGARFSGSNIVTAIVENITTLVDVATSMLSKIPPKDLEQFVAFATTLAGPLGSLFSAVASGGPAMIAVFDRFKDFDFELLVNSIIKHMNAMADLYEDLLFLFNDEDLAEIISFGLVWGGPVKTVLNAIGGFVRDLGIFLAIGGGERIANVLGLLGAAGGNLGGLLGAAGGSAISAAGAALPYVGVGGAMLGAAYLLGNDIQNYRSERISTEYSLPGSVSMNPSQYLSARQKQYDEVSEALADARSRYASGSVDLRTEHEISYYEDVLAWLDQVIAGATQRAERYEIETGRANADNRHGINPYDDTNGMAGYFYSGDAAQAAERTEASVRSLAEAYAETYNAAYESAMGQAAIFADAEETISEAIDRLIEQQTQYMEFSTLVNEIMRYATLENNEIIKEIVDGGVDGIERLQSALNELEKDPHALDGLQRQLHNTKNAMDAASDEVASLITMLSLLGDEAFTTGEMMGINLEYGIRSGASKAVAAAYEMAQAIRNAFGTISAASWSVINEVQYRDIERDPYAGMPLSNHRSNGGLIYAENGKLIHFVPHGTDTVPAMLTPGEFVMRRQAVDTFGAEFMQYINDLNIGAAFDRLIRTDIHSPRSGVVNNYSTKDNHASVNQTIVNGCPGFTYRRASRFVRGL